MKQGRVSGVARVATFLLVFTLVSTTHAAVSARITRITKEVKVRPGPGAQSASRDAVITAGATVRTGADSRAELTFADGTVTRLGGKTILRIGENALNLEDGALLFQAGRRASIATVRTGTIVVEGNDATGIIERFGSAYAKVLVLQGTARVFLPAKIGESILLNPGQILIMRPDAQSLAEPVDFDIGQLYRTSVLIGREFPRLTTQPQIAAEIEKQRANKNLLPTNLVIHGRGTLVTLAESATPKGGGSETPRASPSPSPRPKKTATPRQ